MEQTWSSRHLSLGLEITRCLETRFHKSWSRSWSWKLNHRVLVLVLVLVLEPSSLGLGLSLGTWDSDAFEELHPLLKDFCLPVTSAPLERIFSHSGLLMRANMARMGDNMLSQLVYLRCNNKL